MARWADNFLPNNLKQFSLFEFSNDNPDQRQCAFIVVSGKKQIVPPGAAWNFRIVAPSGRTEIGNWRVEYAVHAQNICNSNSYT